MIQKVVMNEVHFELNVAKNPRNVIFVHCLDLYIYINVQPSLMSKKPNERKKKKK